MVPSKARRDSTELLTSFRFADLIDDEVIEVEVIDNDHLLGNDVELEGVVSLLGESGETVTLDFQWLQRLAGFENELGFFVVDNASGSLDGMPANSMGYAAAALSHASRQVIFRSGEGAGAATQFDVPAGSYLVFYLVQNATTQQFLNDNLGNQVGNGPVAFFSIIEANPDQFAHVRIDQSADGVWRFAWEDLVDGGDQSFTDAVIELEVEIEADQETVLSAPPEIQLPDQFSSDEPIELDVGEDANITVRVNTDFSTDELTFSLDVVGGGSMADLPTIGNDGILRWAPTTLGEYHFDISVTDPNGLSDTERLIFVVTDSGIEEPNPGAKMTSQLKKSRLTTLGTKRIQRTCPATTNRSYSGACYFVFGPDYWDS